MPDPLWFDPECCLIGGAWQAAADGRTLPLVNPSDGSEICNTPRNAALPVSAACRPSASNCMACRQCSRNTLPSSVRRTLRVERRKSGTPTSASSRFKATLAAAGVMSRRRAAAERLPLSAVWRNSSKSLKVFMIVFVPQLEVIFKH